MRTTDGRLKILDFGLARIDPAAASASPAPALATLPGVLIGTPAYMAPEQLNGQPVDARADVFAYGVVIYEYACGVHPFSASTELARIARVLESDARPLGDRCSAGAGGDCRRGGPMPAEGPGRALRVGGRDSRRARSRGGGGSPHGRR